MRQTLLSQLCMAALALAIGCRSAEVSSPPATQHVRWERGSWVKTELYFGLSRPGGGEISREEFERFLAEVVTPRFPDGLSVLEARGQWREASGNIAHESARVLVLTHPANGEASAKIEQIRSEYKSRFGQEAVMRVDDEVKVGF